MAEGDGEYGPVTLPLHAGGVAGASACFNLEWNQTPLIEGLMNIPEKALLLRIYIGESDQCDGRPLFETIVLKAREAHLAGATVLRGPMGFGKSSRVHTAKVLRLSMDLPIVIEIIDSEEKITAFLPLLDTMMDGGLVTLEEIRVHRYEANSR